MEFASNPGEIKFIERAKQLNSFKGLLRRRGITPTDIDGVIDYGGKAFVFIEGKFTDAPMPKGQKMALENIIDNINKEAILLIFTHEVPVDQIVDVSVQYVSAYYYKKEWRIPKANNLTVLDAIEKFEIFCEKYKNISL